MNPGELFMFIVLIPLLAGGIMWALSDVAAAIRELKQVLGPEPDPEDEEDTD